MTQEPILDLSRKAFEELVRRALEGLPAGIRAQVDNVEVVVERRPSRELLREMEMDPEEETLFGLYQGIPLTERSVDDSGVLPDKISIYMEPLLEACRDREELIEEVQVTVVHELAHFFGIDDARLTELGWD